MQILILLLQGPIFLLIIRNSFFQSCNNLFVLMLQFSELQNVLFFLKIMIINFFLSIRRQLPLVF